MSSERSLIAAPPGELVPALDILDTMMKAANHVAKSGLAGTSDASTVLTIALTGRELGIPFMTAVRGVHVIEKKPSLSAEMMQALIVRDHGDSALRIIESTNDKCVIRYRKRGWPEGDYQESEFTIEDAKRAELTGKGNWKKYPKAMLRSRCMAQVAHEAFASSLLGIYTPEELGGAGYGDAWSMEAEPEPPAVTAMREMQAAAATGPIGMGTPDEVDGEYVEVSGRQVDAETGELADDAVQAEDPVAVEAEYRWHKAELEDATDRDALYAAWKEINQAGWGNDDELKALFARRKEALKTSAGAGGR